MKYRTTTRIHACGAAQRCKFMYDSVPPPPGRPVLFLHVSGSGGTTLCRQAAKQPGERGKRVGPNINCQFSCKNPYDYLLYGMRPAADRVVQRCASGIMAAGCSQLETMMHERGFNVRLMHTSCSFRPRVRAHNSRECARFHTAGPWCNGNVAGRGE